jgi:(p)ppGpp synthase/HD superfamily hydrolase
MCHPIRVAEILHPFNDIVLEAAALNHDVLEDTDVTEQQMRDTLGNEVTDLVLEVTKVSCQEDGNRAIRKALDLEFLKNISFKARILKLADVIDNTSNTTEHTDKDYIRMYLSEKWDVVKAIKPPPGDRYVDWLYVTARGNIERAALRIGLKFD